MKDKRAVQITTDNSKVIATLSERVKELEDDICLIKSERDLKFEGDAYRIKELEETNEFLKGEMLKKDKELSAFKEENQFFSNVINNREVALMKMEANIESYQKFKDGDKVRVISSLLPLKGRMQVISAEYIFNERWYYRLAFLTKVGTANKLKKHKYYIEEDLVEANNP